MGRKRVSYFDILRLADKAREFAERERIPLSDLEIELRIEINPKVIIFKADWQEGDPYMTVSL